jgi:hypothetical protein
MAQDPFDLSKLLGYFHYLRISCMSEDLSQALLNYYRFFSHLGSIEG